MQFDTCTSVNGLGALFGTGAFSDTDVSDYTGVYNITGDFMGAHGVSLSAYRCASDAAFQPNYILWPLVYRLLACTW